jgi:hypothetical protein
MSAARVTALPDSRSPNTELAAAPCSQSPELRFVAENACCRQLAAEEQKASALRARRESSASMYGRATALKRESLLWKGARAGSCR